jgi:hypothetical protein
MLANPDLDPSTSINHWILAILTFHFILIHIPSTMHGPDGLSRRRAQPGDDPEPDNDFNDWIDQLYGLMHMINDLPYLRSPQRPIAMFTSEIAEIDLPSKDGIPTSYNEIPRADTAKADE